MFPSITHHILTFLVIVVLFAMESTAQLPIRLISHNIRYATTSPFKGEKPWPNRLPLLLAELRYTTLYNSESFICLQEVLHSQLVDVMSGLNKNTSSEDAEWAYIGVGRDDGKEKGEYSPIIYRPAIWKLESWETVWLSETPEKPGKGWDAASVRIVTVGHFKHRLSNKSVVGLCTHFDDQGIKSRRESAKLILRIVDEASSSNSTLNSGERVPVFLAGDLNSEANGEAYQILNAGTSLVQDVQDLTGERYGERNTFTGFQDSERKTEIDHVFVGPRGGTQWTAIGYAVLSNKFEDGVYVSDHRAVVGDVLLRA